MTMNDIEIDLPSDSQFDRFTIPPVLALPRNGNITSIHNTEMIPWSGNDDEGFTLYVLGQSLQNGDGVHLWLSFFGISLHEYNSPNKEMRFFSLVTPEWKILAGKKQNYKHNTDDAVQAWLNGKDN